MPVTLLHENTQGSTGGCTGAIRTNTSRTNLLPFFKVRQHHYRCCFLFPDHPPEVSHRLQFGACEKIIKGRKKNVYRKL